METPNLSLPYILPSQAQKHVTHNDALRGLDALAQIAVTSRTHTSPPVAPSEGERFIPAVAAVGEWVGRDGHLASFEDGGWTFRTPRAGWLAYVVEDAGFVVHDGAAWMPLATGAGSSQAVDRLGINATADEINRLALRSDASLFDNNGDDHRIKVNKAAGTDTASLLFQSDYSGRAELGLAGSDAFSVKVSADGTTWREAMSADPQTGDVLAGGLRLSRDLQPNLLPDSGRFSGNSSNSQFSGLTFQAPTYLAPHGNATLTSQGKFIHDNTTHGGTAGALDAQVLELVQWLKAPDDRRYGPEWCMMRIQVGSSVAEPRSFAGKSFGLPATSQFTAMPARYTVGYYVKVLSGDALITADHGTVRHASRNGVAMTGALQLTSADGWQFICLQQAPNSTGYNYRFLQLLATTSSVVLVAMPKVVLGHVDLEPLGGTLMNARLFE
jgi:hypothetical protein